MPMNPSLYILLFAGLLASPGAWAAEPLVVEVWPGKPAGDVG
ncbi:MAG: hypothetical protein RIQ93_1076, partial [Verrucomicrobiota bacterium]